MGIQCNRGFVTDYITNIKISAKDAKKYGIQDDFSNYDKDKDGYINSNEFLSGGISNSKIFSAFASLAGDNYSENFEDKYFNNDEELKTAKANKSDIKSNSETQKNNNSRKLGQTNPFEFNSNQKHTLAHPNIDNKNLAKLMDYLA